MAGFLPPIFRALTLGLALGLAGWTAPAQARPAEGLQARAAEARATEARRSSKPTRSTVKEKRAKRPVAAKPLKSGSRAAQRAATPRSTKLQAKRPSAAALSAPARSATAVRQRSDFAPSRPVLREGSSRSVGQAIGLQHTFDPLDLKSNAVLVLDPLTQEVLLAKNSEAVLPIASLTKLMTSLVVVEAGQSLDEVLTVTSEDIDTEKGSGSRLAVGTQLTRGEMLHLALMSSENRAANALGRHYPGGLPSFVRAMNAKAVALGMHDTRYVEPTGLSSQNRSSARDLARLVSATAQQPLIRELSTSPEHRVAVGKRELQYRNTNGLVRNPAWDVVLQKTGYIAEAGRCLVMQARLAGRDLVMVFLDSAGKYSRIGDAERVRRWVESQPAAAPVGPLPGLQDLPEDLRPAGDLPALTLTPRLTS